MPLPLNGPTLAPASGAAPRQIVVLLHGYGSNGADLISFAPLWQPRFPQALFVSPNAPERCPGAPGGYQWWGLSNLDPHSLGAGAARAAPVLDAYLDGLSETHGVPAERMALVGFSQGTMMALHVGLRRKEALAGIVGYSGMMAGRAPPAEEVTSRPPILLVHGAADPVVPLSAHRTAMTALQGLGLGVTGHVTPGLGHSVDLAGIEVGATFLEKALG